MRTNRKLKNGRATGKKSLGHSAPPVEVVSSDSDVAPAEGISASGAPLPDISRADGCLPRQWHKMCTTRSRIEELGAQEHHSHRRIRTSPPVPAPSRTDRARNSLERESAGAYTPADLHIWGGGEGTRTLGLYIANVALYQLSYTPECDKRIAATR